MKKISFLVIVAILTIVLFQQVHGQTKFAITNANVFDYNGRKVIVWEQNSPQTLRLLYPYPYSIKLCATFHLIEITPGSATPFCEKYVNVYKNGLNVAYQDEGKHNVEKGMFFQDESGKYWGPFYYNHKTNLPLVNR